MLRCAVLLGRSKVFQAWCSEGVGVCVVRDLGRAAPSLVHKADRLPDRFLSRTP